MDGIQQFIAAEVFAFGSAHLRHGHERCAVIVPSIPKQESNPALFLRGYYLDFNVFGRIGFRSPTEGLQPRADHNSASLGDELKTVHRFGDEVFGRIAWAGIAVHPEEVRRIDHRRDHITIFRHAHDVLPGVRKVNLALPRHHSESMDRFELITKGSGVVIRPWLQAFRWRTKTYSPKYIEVQVLTAKKKGGIGFLFWNAGNDYSKPFVAMPEMSAARGEYFRGDELPNPIHADLRPAATTPSR